MAGLMDGKRGLIMGLANDKSLAWGTENGGSLWASPTTSRWLGGSPRL